MLRSTLANQNDRLLYLIKWTQTLLRPGAWLARSRVTLAEAALTHDLPGGKTQQMMASPDSPTGGAILHVVAVIKPI